MKTTHLINENKLYSVIGKFFTEGTNLLLELIQNSQRSKAATVKINLPYRGELPFCSTTETGNILRIEDDGCGIRDIVALVGIAISDWGKEIESQDPAGMGFLQLLALSRQVHIQSRFGALLLDSQLFLNSGKYREEVLHNIDKTNVLQKGTVITAEMLKPWHNYMRSDINWYRGYNTLALYLNDEYIKPITIKEMVSDAEEKGNIYHVLNYQGNTLFVEVGNFGPIVNLNRSVVNWYGHLIPVYLLKAAANHCNVRFYYDVNSGTPLTPRYPDRTAINQDDKYNDFMDFLNRTALTILRAYFDSFPGGARFSCPVNASLLSLYYEHAPEAELESVELVPLVDDAFCGALSRTEFLIGKQALVDKGSCFHEGKLLVDDEYMLGLEPQEQRCFQASEKVAAILRKLGIPELVSISTLDKVEKLITVGRLSLQLGYTDNRIDLLVLNNALLLDIWGDAYIYAENENAVHGVLEEMLEQVYEFELDDALELLQGKISGDIDDQLVTNFSLITKQRFDFLPKFHKIKHINFEYGNLVIDYQDGSHLDFVMRG